MRNQIIENFEKKVFSQEKTHPKFRPGDTIKVHYKIEESAKSSDEEKKFRIQVFEGVCTRFKKGLGSSSFTVRKIGANSVGVERVFPFHSPLVDRIDLVAGGKVRRSRLYYLRDLTGKAARIQTRRLPADTVMSTIDHNATPVEKKAKKKKQKK